MTTMRVPCLVRQHAAASRGLRSENRDGTIRRMSTKMIEQELATLKQRLEKLEAKVEHKPQDAWKEIVGAAKDDDLFEEAMKLGAEWRAKANQEGGVCLCSMFDAAKKP